MLPVALIDRQVPCYRYKTTHCLVRSLRIDTLKFLIFFSYGSEAFHFLPFEYIE